MESHAALIRRGSTPLHPLPSGTEPVLGLLPGIRAIAFDIYGTLFISAAGDISLAGGTGSRETALRQAIAEATGAALSPSAGNLEEDYLRRIRQQQDQRRAHGIAWPEVEIRQVWRELIEDLAARGALEGDGFSLPLAEEAVERAAVSFECGANPAWPMPGLGEALAAARERGLALGLVSNAQFYTPCLFPAFLGADPGELGFGEDLQVYSYQHGEGKPSRRLYRLLAAGLAGRGIAPGETLYLGNDLRNDIWPAAAEGFRTALFAGDARSLRWRREDPALAAVRPDRVITSLDQIPALLG